MVGNDNVLTDIEPSMGGEDFSYLLNKKHDVTVFEKNDYIGGHTHTHDLSLNDKNNHKDICICNNI